MATPYQQEAKHWLRGNPFAVLVQACRLSANSLLRCTRSQAETRSNELGLSALCAGRCS